MHATIVFKHKYMNSKNVDASSFDMIRIYFFGEKNVAK